MNNIFICLIFFFINIHNAYSEGYIKADEGIEWDSDNQTYTAIGNVVFKNEKIQAKSNKMIANYIEENQKEIFTVVEFFKDIVINFNEEIFKGNYAIYTKYNNTIKIDGNVTIESPSRLLKGDELIVDLDKNIRILNSHNKESTVEVLIENNADN